ncbi:hypothetical protein I5E68_19700 [Novosphingobium sp. YJ-S2-02]|uniref:Uncharacterized protein n=1 Tax=Novosphingobium aureum TaxID=2792964 RepID=A0A931HG39_9SPHN|nr:hypothetical protein [Novosphingobium aureum]MBH0115172.1 hypothetical protein [Novosphingobium aureum]
MAKFVCWPVSELPSLMQGTAAQILISAIEEIIGWDDLGAEIEEARQLLRPDPLDPVKLAGSNPPILRQIDPALPSSRLSKVCACQSKEPNFVGD